MDRVAVSMGEVAAQAGLPGWAGPREPGGLQQPPFFLMIRGTDLQGLLLCPLVAVEGSVFSVLWCLCQEASSVLCLA